MLMLSRVVGVALLLTAAWIAPLGAQETAVDARSTVEVADEEADRASLRDLFTRPEVQKAARVGRIDLEQAEGRVSSLEGDQLHRAAQQARALQSQLDAQQGEIRITTITLIIILLLVIIIILLA